MAIAQIFAGFCVKSSEWSFDGDCKGHNLAEEDEAVNEPEKRFYI